MAQGRPVVELTDEEWHTGMDVYFLSAVRPTRLVTPDHAKPKGGFDYQYLDVRSF